MLTYLNFFVLFIFHANYLIHKLCTHTLHHKTPYKLIFKTSPSFTNLRTFRCLAYASTLHRHKDKLDPWATKFLFLSFTICIKGFLLFDLNTIDVFTSRNCVFHQSIFPYKPNSPNNVSHTPILECETSTIPFLFDPQPSLPSPGIDFNPAQHTPLHTPSSPINPSSPPKQHEHHNPLDNSQPSSSSIATIRKSVRIKSALLT